MFSLLFSVCRLTQSMTYRQQLSQLCSPMEIIFDIIKYDPEEANQKQCTKSDQIITTFDNKEYLCTQNDILSEDKEKILKNTLTNLTEQLRRSFYTEESNSITLKEFNISDEKIVPSIKETNASLYIAVLLRPIEVINETYVKSFAQSSTNRPIQSAIIIDPKDIPAINDENKNILEEKNFQVKVLHKVIQVMGFSKAEINNWATKAITTNDVKGTYLKGNRIQNVLAHRFGIDTDNASIQLIFDGQKIAAHPAFYLYDAISMIVNPYSAISDLTMAVMEASGWYKGNFTSAEKVTYGLDFTYDTFHATFSPRLALPDRYLSNKAGEYASQDYRSISKVETQPTGDLDELYYDPNHVGVVGIKELGYVPLKVPTKPCDEGKWALDTDEGPSCFKLVEEESKLFVEVDNQNLMCEKGKKVGTKNIVCPDPVIIAKVNKTLNEDPFDYDKSDDQEKWPFILVAFFSVCALAIIVLAVIVCIQRNSKGLEDAKLYRKNILRRAKRTRVGAKNLADKVTPLIESENDNDNLEEI